MDELVGLTEEVRKHSFDSLYFAAGDKNVRIRCQAWKI
jgi:hypothetical protein